MLFSKLKHKDEELLPPPPPFPNLEFEEQTEEKPKFFDEVIKPKKAETFPEEKEFNDLVKKVEESKPKKMLSKVEKTIAKKQFKKIPQQKKINVKKAQPIKIIQVKPIKEKKIILKKPSIKQAKNPKSRLDLEEDFLKDIDFELPKELEKPVEKGIELPETLEDFDIERGYKQKPKEILEAEKEIKSAIENIKKRENKSILKRLFSKKLKEEVPEERVMLGLPAVDDISKIQNKINEAKQALMKFDLETAKRNYIEAMRLYNNISPEEKAKVYHDIKDLYFERKKVEELKV